MYLIFAPVTLWCVYYASDRRKGGNKRCFCPSVCPSVAYIANNSRTQRSSVPKFWMKVPTLDATRISVSRSNGQRSGLEAVGGIPCRPNPAATRTACYLWKCFTKLESLRPPAVIWCLRRRMCVMDSPALRTSPCWHVRDAARYQFECCRPVISKTTHFRCCIVSGRNVQRGMGVIILVWFYANRYMFREDMHQKRFSHEFPPQVTLSFDFLTKNCSAA